MTKDIKFVFNQENPKRIDHFLSQKLPGVSRSQIDKEIGNNNIFINAKQITKAGTLLKNGDIISYSSSLFSPPKLKQISLPIIYEDDFMLVINKPSGVITHSKGITNYESSVASFVKDKINQELLGIDKNNNRAGIVHRLDRGTSGVILVAKTEAARKYLSNQFAKRKVHKTYYAVINGQLSRPEAQINMPIERNPKMPSTFRTGPNGKSAITKYSVKSSNDKYSLILLSPITGRTHQLRVHLKAINHPIVGDVVYGGEDADRLMLHAASIEINLPKIGLKKFEAKLPRVFNNYLNIS